MKNPPAYAAAQRSVPRVPARRGVAVVAVVVLLALVNIAVLASIEAGSDDTMAAAARIETARAFYSADSASFVVLRALAAGESVPAAGSVVSLPSASATIVSAPDSGPGEVLIQGSSGLATRRVMITINN